MKFAVLTVALSATFIATAAGKGFFPVATPESQGVPSQAILDWIDACEQTFGGKQEGRLHGFVLLRHGKVIAEGSWKPFDTLNQTHMLYSHSKSFTSTAIGFLVDAGRLDLDERIVDIFADEAPATVSENMRAMRVRDLLTMNDGMSPGDVCRQKPTENWVKTFLSDKVVNKPGCVFNYDSCATYMLSAIVQKRSGEDLMRFLEKRLFQPLGFDKAWSTTCPDGIPCGGWGMNMTTRDLARFGQLYLQKGVWNGKRILSPDWVALATTRQTWSGGVTSDAQAIGRNSDWAQGYGFQFWRCRHGAYRADGAYGQFTVVMPEQDAVLSVHAGLGDIQQELNLVWRHLLPAMESAPLTENGAAQAKLAERLANLSLAPVPGVFEGCEKYCGIDYAVRQNPRGIRGIALRKGDKGWYLRFFARSWPSTTEIPVGCGAWKGGTILVDPEKYEKPGALIGRQPVQASGAVQPDGTLRIRAYLTGTPARLDFIFSETNGVRRVDGSLWGMCGAEFLGVEARSEAHDDLPPLAEERKWQERRAEVLRAFTVREFGMRPVERPVDLAFKTVSEKPCLGGSAVHRTVEVSCRGPFAPFAFTAHAYLPRAAKKVPSFVSISLKGRLAAEGFDPERDDPSILSLPVKEVLARGYAIVTFTHSEVAADDAKTSWETGVFKAFGPRPRADRSWGALSAWAWGASRVLDWIETQSDFDASRVAVLGHSRGGKAALWAGVTDSRFYLTCVNDSGMAGAKLNRMDLPWSESPDIIFSAFPHWFSALYGRWTGAGAPEGYDQHHLLALVAPRKLAVGSGSEDDWAGPAGERKATELAAEAWRAYGIGGLGANVFYHVRRGPHNLRIEDWRAYMDAFEASGASAAR